MKVREVLLATDFSAASEAAGQAARDLARQSGATLHLAMGFPEAMFPVLFAIPRTSGWLAQWQEMLDDPEQKIARPRQLYLGAGKRAYAEIGKRDGTPAEDDE
jgi:citrate synthase